MYLRFKLNIPILNEEENNRELELMKREARLAMLGKTYEELVQLDSKQFEHYYEVAFDLLGYTVESLIENLFPCGSMMLETGNDTQQTVRRLIKFFHTHSAVNEIELRPLIEFCKAPHKGIQKVIAYSRSGFTRYAELDAEDVGLILKGPSSLKAIVEEANTKWKIMEAASNHIPTDGVLDL